MVAGSEPGATVQVLRAMPLPGVSQVTLMPLHRPTWDTERSRETFVSLADLFVLSPDGATDRAPGADA